jgi:hypothetical protein
MSSEEHFVFTLFIIFILTVVSILFSVAVYIFGFEGLIISTIIFGLVSILIYNRFRDNTYQEPDFETSIISNMMLPSGTSHSDFILVSSLFSLLFVSIYTFFSFNFDTLSVIYIAQLSLTIGIILYVILLGGYIISNIIRPNGILVKNKRMYKIIGGKVDRRICKLGDIEYIKVNNGTVKIKENNREKEIHAKNPEEIKDYIQDKLVSIRI